MRCTRIEGTFRRTPRSGSDTRSPFCGRRVQPPPATLAQPGNGPTSRKHFASSTIKRVACDASNASLMLMATAVGRVPEPVLLLVVVMSSLGAIYAMVMAFRAAEASIDEREEASLQRRADAERREELLKQMFDRK